MMNLAGASLPLIVVRTKAILCALAGGVTEVTDILNPLLQPLLQP